MKALFSFGFIPSQVYNEFLKNLQSNSEDELNFQLNKADRSKCQIFVFIETGPRIMSFNSGFHPFIGIIITSDEREETLRKVFALLKSILPDDSFYNSSLGPSVIMTDNCDELHQSLSYNWPDATLLLCTSHILQQVWRWLYKSCHGIGKNYRVIMVKLFRKLVYAKDIEDYVSTYTVLFESIITSKYSLCAKYFEDMCCISEHWDVFEMMN